MTTNCIVIRENLTVKQAMSSLVEQAAKNDNISTIFMVTEDQTFLWCNGSEGSDHCKTGQILGRSGGQPLIHMYMPKRILTTVSKN